MRTMMVVGLLSAVAGIANAQIELECTAKYNSNEMVCRPRAKPENEARQNNGGTEEATPKAPEPVRPLPPAPKAEIPTTPPSPPVAPAPERQPTSGREVTPKSAPKSQTNVYPPPDTNPRNLEDNAPINDDCIPETP